MESRHRWKILTDGCGCYTLACVDNSTFGLDDPDGNIANNTVVRLWTANSYAQKWRLVPTGDPDGSYKIATKASASVVLDIGLGTDQTVSDNDIVQVVADWSSPNQKWKIVELSP
jgi:hypothetical protein